MERSNYYKGLSIEQIQVADSLPEADFTKWVNGGCSKFALNQVLENQNWQERVGQRPAQNEGFSLIADVLTIPPYESNSVTQDMWNAAVTKFLTLYPQMVNNRENAAMLARFIKANTQHTGMGLKPCVENIEVFFKTCFSRLWLRTVTKIVGDSEPTTPGTPREKTPVFPWLMPSRTKAAKKPAVAPYHFPTPIDAHLVETVLSPDQVRNLSSAETAKMMQRMHFPEVTNSATEYANSQEFLSEGPTSAPAPRHSQSPAYVEREINLFRNAHPEFAKYLGNEQAYRGLYEKVLAKLDEWGFLITEKSLLDAFNWAAHEGIISDGSDADKGIQHGRVSTIRVASDANPHYTTTDVGQIRFNGKRIKDMSTKEYQDALNSSKELRALVDSSS